MSISRIVRKGFALLNASGDPIYGDIRYSISTPKVPVVIICHSFMAFKDWGFFPYAAEKLAEAGFVSIVFNFSHNGVIDHGNRITDLTKFEQNTFHLELSDLGSVLDAVSRGEIGAHWIDVERVALLGHSRGGGISIVKTASDERVRALVTWSAISTFDRWTDHQKARWRSLGYLPLAKDSTTSPLCLGLKLLDDYEQHASELSIVDAARSISIPWLLLHGKADVTVQPHEAETLYRASNNATTDLMLLDSVGHLYNAASPNEDHYRSFNIILHRTTDWLHRHLSQ
ncbi:MAG: prolyl oligopeptidase family serine peptidase [Ignavibacteriae bacterium]|nr:prolyl oligopeptidase family serine peptidase [Ignavibacteria bacterium]MBI3364006.1 prolyl oligopeptidase family serine peptidase [Ignavibacteriota bacterium]